MFSPESVSVPLPSLVRVPVPAIAFSTVQRSVRLKCSAALSLLRVIAPVPRLPAVPPLPTLITPALRVVVPV